MGIKVAKFGGSSLADATQFKKVKDIVLADPDRRFVVPSAPGKRFDGDSKVTAAEGRKILRASAGLETLTPAERMRADVDGDGKIEAADAREALKKSAGVTE